MPTWRSQLGNNIGELKKISDELESQYTEEREKELRSRIDSFLADLLKMNEHSFVLVTDIEHSSDLAEPNPTLVWKKGLALKEEEANGFISTLRNLNQKPTNIIGVFGLEKSGKSCLLNAILRIDLLPSEEKRCTQVITIIRPGPVLRAEVEFVTSEEWANKYIQLRDELENEKNKGRIDEEKYLEQLANLESMDIECRKIAGSPKVCLEYNEEDKSSFTRFLWHYIANPKFVHIIRAVFVYTDKLPQSFHLFEFWDVPGFDSTDPQHRQFAFDAIKKCDSFLFLQSAMKPSITREQVKLLNEMKRSQYDAMNKGFAIITQLDRCHDTTEFKKRLKETTHSLLEAGFSKDRIYEACALGALLAITEPDGDQLRSIGNRIEEFRESNGRDLANGFEYAVDSIKYYVHTTLPKVRMNQAVDIAKKMTLPMVNEAIEIGRSSLPEHIIQQPSNIDQEVDAKNFASWGHIFLNERFDPTIEHAIFLKHSWIIDERSDNCHKIVRFFKDQFEKECRDYDFSVRPIDDMMKRKENNAGFQLDFRQAEDEERQLKVDLFFSIIDKVSVALAAYLYQNHVRELERVLNEKFCPEEPDLFKTSLTERECFIEVRTLLVRVCRPLIVATLRWSHESMDLRRDAVEELSRAAPWISFRIACSSDKGNQQSIPNLGNGVNQALDLKDNNLKASIEMLMERVFN